MFLSIYYRYANLNGNIFFVAKLQNLLNEFAKTKNITYICVVLRICILQHIYMNNKQQAIFFNHRYKSRY